jgi:hypothetical protein
MIHSLEMVNVVRQDDTTGLIFIVRNENRVRFWLDMWRDNR